ncbi:phosphotransferase [Bacillus spizizenii]|nr:phosphotransferase [Bacillus spizizenii]MCY8167695.1 phosphotransferase [Bacillus spizizenii]MCY9234488.1 phosphotransferase [Bacillus spizizenii]MCY9254482.1 phosphotransferase [Bacillus spizizenii]MCY9293485.1 phosphotransferase [Bacillus spizizenii]
MDSTKRRYICQKYGLDKASEFQLQHQGENMTYLIKDSEQMCSLRQYRINRYSLQEIQAEVAWLLAFNCDFYVPKVIQNRDGDWVTSLVDQEGELTFFVMSEFIEGKSISGENKRDYQKLGRLMRKLHIVSDHILQRESVDWKGMERPVYNEKTMICEPLDRLQNASFLRLEDGKKIRDIAEKLQKLLKKYKMEKKRFVHGDLHLGNIVDSPRGWYCLDFDESGFGHEAFDIGVPRIHLLASDQLDNLWPSFLEGYQFPLSEEILRLGTALRLFYMAGKIPLRLDIPDIQHDPQKKIRRYLHLIELELSGVNCV